MLIQLNLGALRVFLRVYVCLCVTTLQRQRRQTASTEMPTVKMQQHLRESSNNNSSKKKKNKTKKECTACLRFHSIAACTACLPVWQCLSCIRHCLHTHTYKQTLQLSSTCRQCRKCVRSLFLSIFTLHSSLLFLGLCPSSAAAPFFC